jgi:hypothetical protein
MAVARENMAELDVSMKRSHGNIIEECGNMQVLEARKKHCLVEYQRGESDYTAAARACSAERIAEMGS